MNQAGGGLLQSTGDGKGQKGSQRHESSCDCGPKAGELAIADTPEEASLQAFNCLRGGLRFYRRRDRHIVFRRNLLAATAFGVNPCVPGELNDET